MTMNFNSFFSGRVMAACCALLLSATMVLGSVGPAFNIQAPSQSAQSYIA